MTTDPPEYRHVQDLLTFLKFPSVSTDPAHKDDMRACADWLALKLKSTGMECAVHPTPGHPIVLARSRHLAGKPTVLIYGHYDVQPVDPPHLWNSPPFEPVIKNGYIYARGATDNKGQILAHILGIQETLRTTGELPCNVTVLVEGEEETGSENLGPFLRQHRDALACDVVAVSDTGMVAPGVPTFTYALRGIGALEVTLTGPDKDLHSGVFGGAVANPITALARLLATLHDEHGRIAIQGFYDRVRPLAGWEREAWARLPYGDAEVLELTGSPGLFGETGFTSVERTWARPTMELNGIIGGYTGEGTKTVLPSSAHAKITFRLVPDQDPARVTAMVQGHLEAHCPPGVRITCAPGHHGRPYLFDPHSPHGLAAQRALSNAFGGRETTLIREGGSIPIVTDGFLDILGVPTLLLGLALPDCRAHSPNENFPLDNLTAGIRLNQHLLRELSGA